MSDAKKRKFGEVKTEAERLSKWKGTEGPRDVMNQKKARASGSGGSYILDESIQTPPKIDTPLSDDEGTHDPEGAVAPEGKWEPLPEPIHDEADSDDSEPKPDPPSFPKGKGRPLARKKKPTDGKMHDEDDMPAMGAFGLFAGARDKCKLIDMPACWTEQSDGETTAGSDSDVIDISGTDSSDEWEFLDNYPKAMELEFEEYKQTPPQQPRGYYKPKRAVAPVAN